MSTGTTELDARPPGRRRGWARLWQTPIFVLGLACLALVAAWAALRDTPGRQFERELRHLRQALQGEHDLPDLQTSIEPLIGKASEFPRSQAECEFLLGSYFYRLGELEPAKAEWSARANQHLSRALTLNIAESDLAMLFFRLGMTHYRQGQHLGQALNWVRQGLELGAENPANGYAFLVEAYLKMPQPNLAAALSANQRHLEYVDDRDPEAIGKARYLHADILQRLDRRAEALRELEQIEANVPAPLLANVRLLQATCSEAEEQWSSALEFWKQLEPLAAEVPGGKGRIYYALGLAHTQMSPCDDAAVVSMWKQAVEAGGEEGQAAAIRLGHRLIADGRFDPEQALKYWGEALGNNRVGAEFKNSYVDLATVLELFDQSCELLLEKGDFARSQALANLVARVAPPGAAEEKIARTQVRWANDLSAQAQRSPSNADALLREARARFQDAGDYFKQATVSREPSDKIELFWQSASCYLSARDFANAAMALETFVVLTLGDERNARGHFALAEACQAQGQKAKARGHYVKCIELDTAPYAVRALARLAQVEIDARKLDSAREILLQILGRNGPDVERDIFEQALYSLGNVLFDLGEADEGAIRLREAVRRFPSNPKVWAARHRLADHAWDRAKQIMVAEPQLVAIDRRPLAEAMIQKRRDYLMEAHDAYQTLARDLEELYNSQKSLPMEPVLFWRNSLFNIGNLKLELGDAALAMTYFRNVQLLYRGKAESLFAARNVYSCWQQLARTANNQRPQFQAFVLEAVRTALRDLEEIPRAHDEEIFLSGATPFSRQQWRDLLAQWEVELGEPARAN
jgi:tetratricopeptide (TPR) repeat protein